MALHHFKKILTLSEGIKEKESYNSNCSHNHNNCTSNSIEIENVSNCTSKRQHQSKKMIDKPISIDRCDDEIIIDTLSSNCTIDDKKDRSRNGDECSRRGCPVLLHGVRLGEVLRATIAEELSVMELENSQSCLRFGGS